jgi:predicted Zn-dependent peptidase
LSAFVARLIRAPALRVFIAGVLALLLVVPGLNLADLPGAFASQASPARIEVTLSATAEVPDETQPPGSILIQIGLANRSDRDVGSLILSSPVPEGVSLLDSWFMEPGLMPAAVNDDALVWRVPALEVGETLGPFVYRLTPDEDHDGATVFRDAWIEPRVVGLDPLDVVVHPMRLNGLWGERGLRRTLLPTSLTVFTVERPDSPTVSLRVAVRAGSRDEDDTTSGGAHWLEHGHFLGTVRRPGGRIDVEAAAEGAHSNASTGWEATDYWYLVPGNRFEQILDLLADQIINSTFRQEAFDRERPVVFEELKMRNDRPATRAFDEFINLVFQVSPLRRHPAGTIESVESIPIATILAYRDRHYVTGNTAIAVSGRIEHDAAVAAIEEAFADLPQGPRLDRPAIAEPIQTTRRVRDVGTGTRSAEVRLGWPTPGDDNDDSVALYILDDILGDTGRRLTEEIRDRRALATSAGSSFNAFADAGFLMLGASTRPESVDQVIDLLLAEIRRARDGGITAQDVQVSLRALAGRRAIQQETNQAQTGRAQVEVSGVLDSFDEYLARLRRVTPADIQRVAQTYLDPNNYTLVIVRS